MTADIAIMQTVTTNGLDLRIEVPFIDSARSFFGLGVLGHSQDLFERSDTLGGLTIAVFSHGQMVTRRGGGYLGGRRSASDHLSHIRRQAKHLEDAQPTDVSGLPAVDAAFAAEEPAVTAIASLMPNPLENLLCRLMRRLAVRTDRPNEALG